jgi:exosortase A
MFAQLAADIRAIRQFKPLLLILLAVPAVFFGTTASMAKVWASNETFTHGFIILPISIWLMWQQKERIAAQALAPDPRALFLLVPTLGVWLLATLIDIAIVQQFAMVALIPLSVWLLLGRPLTLALLFPLLYLFFAVPAGQGLIPPMMEFTADFTVRMIQMTGVPVYREGLSFDLPTGSWSVVEECSGVRYLIASAALGTIYAYTTYRSNTKRAVFIAVSFIVPIFANGLRAYGIVMIGHLSGMKYAVGVDHLLYGWVFFGIVIFVLFWIGSFWADPPPRDAGPRVPVAVAGPSRPIAMAGIALLAVFLALNLGLGALKARSSAPPAEATLHLPTVVGDWRSVAEASPDKRWQPILHAPDLITRRTYANAEHTVSLDLGYFHAQRDGAEAISSLNRLSDPYEGEWKLIATRYRETRDQRVAESELISGPRKVLVWQLYLVTDRFLASPLEAKLYQARQLLRGNSRAAYITLSTPVDNSPETARQRLDELWQLLENPLRQAVADVGRDG